MEESKILQYFEGKTIFITGATGFLAKIFLEKILRVQPNVEKLYLLIRTTSEKSVEQRLQEEIVGTELFRVLREGCGEEFNSILSSNVIPVSGDVSYENLGIVDSKLREEMWREIDIIVNSAATTKFDDRYDVAFGINVMGTIHVAYVNGTRAGLILEKPLSMGETTPGARVPYLDINSEKNSIQEKLRELQMQKLTEKEITRAMKDFGIERARLHGWPNSYVFTKAMGEMLLENFKENANIVIIRPTIITSTLREPIPGWIEGVRTLDSLFVGYGKGKLKFFVGDPETMHDMIPADMVVNCMLAATALLSNDQNGLFVYQVGSSRRNPVKFGDIKLLMHRYLIENPMQDSKGKPTRVGQPTTMNTMASFRNYIETRYLPLIKILKLINLISCNYFQSLYVNARRRLSNALRLAELYKHYLFSQSIFDDTNTENLRMRIRGSCNTNTDVLNFDPKCIKWDEYFMNVHFPGITKYVMNE